MGKQTVKSGAELRAATTEKAEKLANNTSSPQSKAGISPTYQNTDYVGKKTVRSGEELRQISGARTAQLQKSTTSGTFNPSNTRNVGVMNYYNNNSEEDYIKFNNRAILSDYATRITDYAQSGTTNYAKTKDFLQQAMRYSSMAGDDELKKSWEELSNAVRGQYLYDYTNQHSLLMDQKDQLQSVIDTQRKYRQDASDAIALGLYYEGDPQLAYKDANLMIKNNTPILADVESQLSQMEGEAESIFLTPEIRAAMDRLSRTGNPTRMWNVYREEMGAKNEHEAVEMRNADQKIADDFRLMLSQPKKFYTTVDVIANTEFGWGERTAAGYANFESLIARAVGQIKVANSAEEEQALLNGEITKETPDWAKAVGAHGERVNEWAKSVNEDSQDRIAQAKASASKFGQFGIDLAMTAMDVAFDTVTGMGLASMGARVMGQTALEAQEKGAGLGGQILYGAANAAVEMLTEKLGDGLGYVYGKGVTSDIVEEAIGKLAKTQSGANWLRFLINSSSEGAEEVISDLAAPFLNWIIDEKARNEHLYEIDASELLYDYLLGSAVGMFGQVGERIGGAYAGKNKELGIDKNSSTPGKAGDNTAGKEGYLKRYAGSETEALGKQQSPQMGKGEQLSAEGEYHPEYQNDVELPSKKDLKPNEAPGIPESTPEEKQANREAGRKAEWLVKEAQKKGAKTSLVNMVDTDWNRVAEAYEAATGEKLQHGKYKKQLKSFVDKQTGKTDVKAKKTEAPSVSSVEASQSAPASGGTDIAPAPVELVKPTPTPTPETTAQVPPARVDNKPVEVHNEPVGKTVTSADLQEAASRGIGELTELYNGADPESFANAYKEITGEDFDDFDASSSLREFYRQSLQAAPAESAPADETPAPEPDTNQEEQKAEAKKQLLDRVKSWVENPTESDILDADAIKLARDNDIDVYEIWNDDNTKLIGWGVDDDTFTIPEQKQDEQKPVEPEPVKPAEEQKPVEKPKPEPKQKKEPKPPKEKKPSVKEQRQAALAERGITADNIGLKIKDGSATRADIEEVVAAGLLTKTAAGEVIKARGGVGTAKSYADLLDTYENPVHQMSESEFAEKAKAMTWDEIKAARRRGEFTDAVFEAATGINWANHKAAEKFSKWKEAPTTAEERASKKAEKELDKEGNPTDRAKLKDESTPWDEAVRIITRNHIRGEHYKLLFDALDPDSTDNQEYYDAALKYAGAEENAEAETISSIILDELVNQFDLSNVTEKNRQIAVERELERLRAIREKNNKKANATFEAKKNFVEFINKELDKLNVAKVTTDDIIKRLAFVLHTNAIKVGGDPVYNALEARYAFEEMSGIHIPMDVSTAQDVYDYLGQYEDEIGNFMQQRLLGKMQAEQKQKAADKAELTKLMAEQAKDDKYGLKIGEAGNTQKGGNANVRTELRKANRGRVLGGSEARVEYAFGEAGRRGLAGTTGHAFRRWRDYTRKYEREGAVRLNAEQLDPVTAGTVNELLESGVSFVTVLDASKMKKSPGLFGFVINKAEGAGVFLFVNDPAFEGNSVPKGVVVLHEPVHYFSGLFANRSKTKSRPNYTKALGDVGSAIGVHPYRLIALEQRFSGRDMWIEAGVETLKDDAEWKKFRSMSVADQNTYLKKYLDDDVRKYVFAKLCEEAAANIAAKNPSLDFDGSGINMEKAAKAMRKYLYDNHIVPRGLFERLEPYANAISQQTGTAKASEGVLPKSLEQRGLTTGENATEEAKAEPDYTPEFKEAPTMPEYMREAGEDEETPKYAPSQEHTIAPRMYKGQKAEYGRVKHEVLTKEEITKVAKRYMKGALASKESFKQAVDWLDYRAGAMNPYELYMAQLLFSDTGDAISQLARGRHPSNPAFRGYTIEELSEANQLLKESVADTKTPAAQILAGKAEIPDTQQVRINAREAFFKGLESGEIDPNATDTKLEGMVEDYTYHIEKLDAEATHDVQKMLKLTKDIAYVRNNSAIFGVAGKSAQQIESFVLDYIAKHDPNAYDTLRQFALGSVNRISSDFQNVGVSATLGQVRYLNMLSNFATAVSNIGNNDISIFNEANAQNIGRALLGKYFEAVTGEEQVARDYTNSLSPKEVTANLNAMALGAAKGLMSLYYGLEVDESNSGKADYKIGAKFNQNTKVFGSQAFGRFLARMTFLSGIKMQVTDTAAKARTLRGMNAGVERMNLSDERKALMYTDNKNNADYRLFHEDSPINIAIGKIRKQLDSKLRLGNDEVGYLGLGTLMMPFVKVPINVATHALRATPVGTFVGMAQVARGMRKANRMHSRVLANQIAAEDITDPAKWAKAKKELDSHTYRILEKNRGTDAIPNKFEKAVRLSGFENASEMSQEESASIIRKAGRVVTNTGLTVLGVLAAWLGAVKNFDDEDDDDMARLAKEHGLTGLQFNFSAVLEGRKDQWDFDNDIIIGGSWLEIASIPFVAGAEIWKDAQEAGKGKELEGALKSAAFSPVTSLVNVADILKDMPGLQQLNNIYEAIENSSRYNAGNFKEKAVDSTIQYAANQLASFMIPNSIAQLSAGLDNTVRDVYTTDDPLKTAANIIVNKTPFRSTIPARLTATGEIRRYDDTTLRAVINKTILPGDFHRVTYSDLEKEWLAMSRAGATNVMPPASAPKKVTLEGEDYTLTADEKREWHKICTENTAALQSMIQGSPYWDQLSPEMQKKAFQDARKTAEHDATYMVKGDEANLVEAEYYDRWELNQNGDTGIAEFLPTKYYVKSMYDKDGAVSDYDALNKFIRNDYDKLDDETKVLLENSFHDLDAMDEAWDEAKITAEEYYAAKAIYKEVSGKQGYKDAADIVNMHVEFDKLFNGDRKKVGYAEDHFTIFNQTPGDTRTKDKIIGNGYSLDLARQYINYNDQTSFSAGYDELQDHQKFNNVVKMKFDSEQERWDFFFDNVMPKQNTGQIKKLRKCMEAGDTLAEALEKVKDSEGNSLSTVYSKDKDGNKYVA